MSNIVEMLREFSYAPKGKHGKMIKNLSEKLENISHNTSIVFQNVLDNVVRLI